MSANPGEPLYEFLHSHGLEVVYSKFGEKSIDLDLSHFIDIESTDLQRLCDELELNIEQSIKFKKAVKSLNNHNNNNNNCSNINNSYNNNINSNQLLSSSSLHHSSILNSENNIDYKLKIILAGDSATGKTCLIHRFLHNKFSTDYVSTIGIDFGSKTILTPDNNLVELQIWDTCGQERFDSVSSQYFRGSHCVIIVYDITKRDSFKCIENRWIDTINDNCDNNTYIVLVGNKLDKKIEFSQKLKKHKSNNNNENENDNGNGNSNSISGINNNDNSEIIEKMKDENSENQENNENNEINIQNDKMDEIDLSDEMKDEIIIEKMLDSNEKQNENENGNGKDGSIAVKEEKKIEIMEDAIAVTAVNNNNNNNNNDNNNNTNNNNNEANNDNDNEDEKMNIKFVSTSEGLALANKYNFEFCETSAKSGHHIPSLFLMCAVNALERKNELGLINLKLQQREGMINSQNNGQNYHNNNNNNQRRQSWMEYYCGCT